MPTIRVMLPQHLQVLAAAPREVKIEIPGVVTQTSIIDALEQKFLTLRGTIRDQVTKKRRPMVRFFACEEDISHDDVNAPLPEKIVTGEEPFYIIGAIAGG